METVVSEGVTHGETPDRKLGGSKRNKNHGISIPGLNPGIQDSSLASIIYNNKNDNEDGDIIENHLSDINTIIRNDNDDDDNDEDGYDDDDDDDDEQRETYPPS